jgi:uncharacterized lipoprotein
MRQILITVLLCLAGCASDQQRKEYERQKKDWYQDNDASHEAWLRATGGQWSGGGTPMPEPKKPGPIRLNGG